MALIHCTIKIQDLGCIDYQPALCIQQKLHRQAVEAGEESLLVCEHNPVITTGRLFNPESFLVPVSDIVSRGVAVIATDRGGDVTLHSPGQVILYPILDLKKHGQDLRAYIFYLEQVAIDFFKEFDIVANRFSGRTGVWFQGKKIASLGLGVKKWISFHGLSININNDLRLFSLIRPCGLDVAVTSLSDILGEEVAIRFSKEILVNIFLRNIETLNDSGGRHG